MCPICLVVALLLIVLVPAAAAQMQMPAPPTAPSQQQPSTMLDMANMPGMSMPADPSSTLLMEESSGTSIQPRAWAMPMVDTHTGTWQLSWMAQAFLVDVQQSHVTTPTGTLQRAGDKLYSTNWGMLSATHPLSGGTVMLRTMLSLEPATIADRRYPELFQIGETAFGQPLVDGQHPHNLFMEIGTQYAHPIGNAVLNLYYAPVGDPALGPTAYPHRASAAELPQATLGHHWEDSTHISDNVTTAELAWRHLHFEAGGFYGREPGENRWNLGFGPIDSWTARLTWLPASNGRRRSPPAAFTIPKPSTPATKNAPLPRSNTPPATAPPASSGAATTRPPATTPSMPSPRKACCPSPPKTSSPDDSSGPSATNSSPPSRPSHPHSRPGSTSPRYTAGYTRLIGTWHHAGLGIGANATGYTVADGNSTAFARNTISSVYGNHPWAVSMYLRIRLEPTH